MPDDDALGSAATQLGKGTAPTAVTGSLRDSSPSLALMSDVLAGRYEIRALLGVGGMGRVYRAHDRALDDMVALKLLRRELVDAPEMVERFRREVKLARRVTSPHVVRTFDLGQHGDEHFLTMELVEGRSLGQQLEDGPITTSEALRIARAACSGIAAAHAAGVWHRDLKPDNVLVGTAGRIAITDFGIARANASAEAGAAQTVDRFVGTPAYMAPEQVDGSAPIGPATDVYAFGLVVYEMLAGRRAFTGADPMQVAVARLSAAPPDPRAHRPVPAALAELVVRCLAREPAGRFADGGAVSAALAAIGELEVTLARPAPIAPVVPDRRSRAIAVLPLRAAPELAELADGLGEEIVDGLTLTRALRVRPMASVRALATPGADPREVGRALGVDVVVDGSLRRVGDVVRITARAIGVEDGFQLSADRIDARGDELLAAGDAIARAVARALTVELDPRTRAASDPRATELYLEGKARMRAGWMTNGMRPAIEILERARALAPDDASIAAAYAIARARDAFFGTAADVETARVEARRVVDRTPDNGEAWLALGLACTYACELAPAASALVRAVQCAPGLAQAQQALGGVLLEVGAIDEAVAHLEAAIALDPTSLATWDVARALVFTGRTDEAIERLVRFSDAGNFAEILIGRFKMWRGERYTASARALGMISPGAMTYSALALRFYEHGVFSPAELAEFTATALVTNRRLRSSRLQFGVEFLCASGDPATALDHLQLCVDAGLHDAAWVARCPLLDLLRDSPRFASLSAVVSARANAVLDAIGLPR